MLFRTLLEAQFARYLRRNTEGRIASLTDHTGQTILTWAWTGDKVASITDHAGRSVSYHYTGENLTSVTDVLGNAWNYEYSGGLLHKITDPEGHTTSIDYAGNRVVKLTDALDRVTTYEYDYDRGTRDYTAIVKTPSGQRTETRYNAKGKQTFRVIKGSDSIDITEDVP